MSPNSLDLSSIFESDGKKIYREIRMDENSDVKIRYFADEYLDETQEE